MFACNAVNKTQCALLLIDFTQADRTGKQLAPILCIYGDKLSRFCVSCYGLRLQPHAVDIFANAFLADHSAGFFYLCAHFLPPSGFPVLR